MLHKKTRLTSLVANTLLAGSLSMGCAYNVKTDYPKIEYEFGSLRTEKERNALDKAIEEYEKKNDINPESVKMRMLMNRFTPEAFEKLKDIPVVEARVLFNESGYAAGRNFFLNILQSTVGYGWGRKTVVNEPNVKEASFDHNLLHEYIHHASALDLINDDKFETAWEIMSNDPKYKDLTKTIDGHIDENYCIVLMALVPIWRTIEREAMLAEHVLFGKFTKLVVETETYIDIRTGAKGSITAPMRKYLARELPDYMQEVYSRTLVFNKPKKLVKKRKK